MLVRAAKLHTRVLQGFAPSIVRTGNAAHELAEMYFTRLGGFEFVGGADHQLVTSGMRDSNRSVCLVSSSGHYIWLRDEEKIFYLFPYRGTITVEMSGKSAVAGPSEMIVVGPGERRTRLSQDYLGGMIYIPLADAQLLDAGLSDVDPGRPLDDGVQHVDSPAAVAPAHALLEMLESRVDAASMAAQWMQLVRPLWEALRLRESSDSGSREKAGSLGQVRMAEAFMDTHKGNSLTLSDVARAARIGPRALQMAFKRHRRSTPRQFLHQRRLTAARDLLLADNSDLTVTDVALSVGFTHLSRFSHAYRSAFGEYPSETRRKSAGDR